jgi:para-nitrobenzyl esterase
MHRISLCVLVACSSMPATPVHPDAPAPSGPGIVIVETGALRGRIEGDVIAWRGIPYAAPPIGDARWQPPQPPASWTGVRDANGWSAGCIETSTSNALIGGSEDCLYLHVWAPASGARGLPVLVFIHGGFFLFGSASTVSLGDRMYDGGYVAAHGPAIVVTLDYRLGAFGFFGGNHAIEDQIAALGWVQRNIAAFGGDPAHVLVFGESAGGYSVCQLVASAKAAGLFSAALVESGGCVAKPAARASALDASLLHGLGCDTAADPLACARSAPADRVATAATVDLTQLTDHWAPFVDGTIIAADPYAQIVAGRHNHVPLVIGNTANEYSTLIGHYLSAPVTTDADYRAQVARLFPALQAAVLAEYPSSAYASPLQALIAVASDANMVCPARRIARAAGASQSQPVRRYLFAHVYESGPVAAYGAGHALDLPFEFHNLGLTGFTPSAAELALSDAIVGYWTRFAATGDPNDPSAPTWPIDAAQNDLVLRLDDAITAVSGVRTEQCDFWDAHG